MARLAPIDPDTASPDAARALHRAAAAFGGTTLNLTRVMAHSPAVLHGYLDLAHALEQGVLEEGVRERIALLVAEQNGCPYCLSAHTFVAQRVLGLAEAEIAAARRGDSADPRTRMLLAVASAINLGRGDVDDSLLDAAFATGVTEGDVAEVVAHVAANTFTNFVAKSTRVDVDFPRVTPGNGAA